MSNDNETPTTPTNPQESLALRYSYEQLRAPYKGYADQVSALMKAYGDILAIQDPAERKGAIDKLKSWVSGQTPTREQLDQITGPLGDAARALGLGAGMDAAQGVAGAVAGGARMVGAMGNGLMLPIDFAKGILGFGSDVVNEGWNSQLSEAQAREIGTAYGSVLQAQSENRGGMFSTLGNVWAYTRAAFATAWDFVRPLLAKLPWVGELFDATTPTRSFDEHLQRALIDSDVNIVRDEFAKVPEIGGLSGATLGQLLTQGGVMQNAAGQNMQIAAPTSDNPTPNAPGAPLDANGNPKVADRNIGASTADALRNAGNGFKQRVGARIAGIDTPEEVAGATLGVAGTGLATHGAAAKIAERHLVKPAERATAAEQKALKDVKALEERMEAAKAGKKPHFWSKGPENIEELQKSLGKAEEVWELRATEAKELGDPSKRVAAATEHPNRFVRGVGKLAESAHTKPTLNPLTWSGAKLSWNPFTWPGAIGRGVGNAVGFVSEPVTHRVGKSVAKDIETTRSMWSSVRGWFGATEAAPESAASAAQATETQSAAKAGMRATGEAAAEVAEKSGLLADTLRVGGKFMRALPLVGVVGTTGGLFWAAAANAETVDGKKLSGVDQLSRDFELGRISRAEYEAYRGIQVAYSASGLLGLFGGGVLEAVQAGAEHLDVGKVSRYLPPSIVKEVAGMIQGNDGAAGPADKGLQVAAIDQTKQAQDAARKAALAFRNSNVQSGAILRNEDGSLRALNFGANGQEINAPTATV